MQWRKIEPLLLSNSTPVVMEPCETLQETGMQDGSVYVARDLLLDTYTRSELEMETSGARNVAKPRRLTIALSESDDVGFRCRITPRIDRVSCEASYTGILDKELTYEYTYHTDSLWMTSHYDGSGEQIADAVWEAYTEMTESFNEIVSEEEAQKSRMDAMDGEFLEAIEDIAYDDTADYRDFVDEL